MEFYGPNFFLGRNQGVIWGVTPLGVWFHLQTRGKKWRYFYTFSAPKAPKTCFSRRRRRREKFLSTFFEIFVKFVNKNAIKSDFWGDCVEVSRKFSKNPRFWQKSISPHGRKFQSISPQVPSPPPKKISLVSIGRA